MRFLCLATSFALCIWVTGCSSEKKAELRESTCVPEETLFNLTEVRKVNIGGANKSVLTSIYDDYFTKLISCNSAGTLKFKVKENQDWRPSYMPEFKPYDYTVNIYNYGEICLTRSGGSESIHLVTKWYCKNKGWVKQP